MQLPDPEELFEVLAKKIHVAKIPDIALVGIHTGGVWLAQRLHQKLGIEHPLGMLDVSLMLKRSIFFWSMMYFTLGEPYGRRLTSYLITVDQVVFI